MVCVCFAGRCHGVPHCVCVFFCDKQTEAFLFGKKLCCGLVVYCLCLCRVLRGVFVFFVSFVCLMFFFVRTYSVFRLVLCGVYRIYTGNAFEKCRKNTFFFQTTLANKPASLLPCFCCCSNRTGRLARWCSSCVRACVRVYVRTGGRGMAGTTETLSSR